VARLEQRLFQTPDTVGSLGAGLSSSPAALVTRALHHHLNEREHGRCEAVFTPRWRGRIYRQRLGTEMARPQTPTAKPAKQSNTARDKMRMGYDRMRRDIKRTEVEQAKAAAIQAAKRRRK
jgi:hypothetical protein